jgi:hypothetical protein
MNMDGRPVVVYTAQGEVEESQVRAFLEAHGIPTSARGEALRHTHSFTLNGLGAVDILVAPEHEGVAKELLAKVADGEFVLTDDWSDPTG